MTQYLRDWWVELTSPATYRRSFSRRPWTCAFALWFVCTTFALPVVFFGCATTGAQVTRLNHLLRAAEALHQLAEHASELEGDKQAEQVLLEQLPYALDRLGEALSELCAQGGPLPPDHKVCRHYRAYVNDPG